MRSIEPAIISPHHQRPKAKLKDALTLGFNTTSMNLQLEEELVMDLVLNLQMLWDPMDKGYKLSTSYFKRPKIMNNRAQ